MIRPSFNILGQFLTNQQWDDCLNFLNLYRPTTCGVMDNINRAYDVMSATAGETLVWHRMWRQDDAYLWKYTTPEDFVKQITNDGKVSKALWLYVLNEPDTNPNTLPLLVRWLVEVGDILADQGRHAIMGNIGPATVQPETITSGVFDPYLRRLAEWSAAGQHYAGWHEYTGVMLPFGVGYWPIEWLLEPEKVQLDNWPEISPTAFKVFMDVQPEPDHYWHLLRTERLQLRAVEIGAGRFKSVLTEFGVDRMPDLSAAMPNIFQQLEAKYGASRGTELKGWRTYEKVYAAYWPNWSFEKAVYEQLAWADRNYPDDYLGFNVFAWVFDASAKDKSQRWEWDFNMGDLYELQGWLLSSQDEMPPGPTPIPPDPEPEPDTPLAEPWMLWLAIVLCGAVLGAIIYSFVQPHIQYVAMEVNPVEELLNQLFAIPALAPITFSGAIILYLVEIGKRLKAKYIPDILPWLTPEFMVVFWVVFFMSAFGLAQQYAYDNVFKQVAEVVTQLVTVLGPYVLGMIGTQVAVAAAHNGIRKVNVSGFDQ